MAAVRIAEVTIPYDKKIKIALTYVYGIGSAVALEILAEVGVDPEIRVKDLEEKEVNKIREEVDKKYEVEGDLRRKVISDIKRLKEIGCYRGTRHAKGLPVRGQSTKNNNRTVRGNKRGMATSGKKKIDQKT